MPELKQATSLYDRTLHLIKTRPANLTFDEIARDTDIKASWLRCFARGKIGDPSVNRIQTLYEYLSNKKLKV